MFTPCACATPKPRHNSTAHNFPPNNDKKGTAGQNRLSP